VRSENAETGEVVFLSSIHGDVSNLNSLKCFMSLGPISYILFNAKLQFVDQVVPNLLDVTDSDFEYFDPVVAWFLNRIV
jgi:hypothetical protein